MGVYKKNGNWFIDFYCGSKRIRRMIGPSKRLAETALKDAQIKVAKGEYLGGNIAPGMSMRFKALHRFTSRLPMLEAGGNGTEFWGTTTEKAILSGVMNGSVFEIEGFIREFSSQFERPMVVLTGGDAKSFEKKLKNSIFVVSHLNLIGLNRILEHNAKQDNRE